LKRTASLPFFALILFLLSASVAFSEVPIRVRAIQASNVRSAPDPLLVDRALKDIYRELGTLFSFNSYRLLQEINLNLTGNRSVEVIVHPGRSMEITLVGEYRNLVELRIKVKREGSSILITHVRLASGRTILIGGPRHGEGVIIFAISGRF
jgi:hypothetical protein